MENDAFNLSKTGQKRQKPFIKVFFPYRNFYTHTHTDISISNLSIYLLCMQKQLVRKNPMDLKDSKDMRGFGERKERGK